MAWGKDRSWDTVNTRRRRGRRSSRSEAASGGPVRVAAAGLAIPPRRGEPGPRAPGEATLAALDPPSRAPITLASTQPTGPIHRPHAHTHARTHARDICRSGRYACSPSLQPPTPPAYPTPGQGHPPGERTHHKALLAELLDHQRRQLLIGLQPGRVALRNHLEARHGMVSERGMRTET